MWVNQGGNRSTLLLIYSSASGIPFLKSMYLEVQTWTTQQLSSHPIIIYLLPTHPTFCSTVGWKIQKNCVIYEFLREINFTKFFCKINFTKFSFKIYFTKFFVKIVLNTMYTTFLLCIMVHCTPACWSEYHHNFRKKEWRNLEFISIDVEKTTHCTYVLLIVSSPMYIRCTFSSNHNIHKSLYGLCFWAADPLINRFL